MDLKNIDLKNINIEDIKKQILQFTDKKTLIKTGISVGAIIVFLIIYYSILNPLVNKKKHLLFKQVNSIEQFRKLVPGQFHTWSDTKVLESNNIRVEKGADFEGLFLMLDKERFDYFPRSVLEVDHEYEAHKLLNITIDSSVLVHYPTANYFYVANFDKKNQHHRE